MHTPSWLPTGTPSWVLMDILCHSLPKFSYTFPQGGSLGWRWWSRLLPSLRYGRLCLLRGAVLSHRENHPSGFPLQCCEMRRAYQGWAVGHGWEGRKGRRGPELPLSPTL